MLLYTKINRTPFVLPQTKELTMNNITKYKKTFSKFHLEQAEEYETHNIVVIIRYKNIRGSQISLSIPIYKFREPSQLFKILLSKGFPLPNNGHDFCAVLSEYKFSKTVLLSSQSGWYKSNDDKYCYVLPNLSFGYNYNPVIFNCDNTENKEICRCGSLKEYQRLLDICRYSPPAILTIGAALSTFCLFPFGFETFGIHLFGDSSIGKSTLGRLACSILGNSKSYISWKTTDGGIEEVCFTHRDRVLVFDEAKLLAPTRSEVAVKISNASYFICAGQTKKRLTSYNKENKLNVGGWELTFISTGEFGIIENAQATGHLKDDGEKLRFIDVPAQMSEKYGIFSKLPKQYSDSLEIIDDINQTLQDNYGLLGRIFLKKLVNILNKDENSFKKHFYQNLNFFIDNVGINVKSGYSQRFLSRFAFTYAVLIQAYEWKLIPWKPNRIFKAIKKMYALALNCIRDDADILNEGLGILKQTLSTKNDSYVSLKRMKNKEDIKEAWNDKKFFAQKNPQDELVWIIPSQTFKSWFATSKQAQLVKEALGELIQKNNEGYTLCSLGYGIRKRAICLNRKKLKKLLSK